MENNFMFIWYMVLEIVKWHFEKGDDQKAYDVFDKGASLVAKDLPKAYKIAVEKLTPDQMNIIWKLDTKNDKS